LFYIASVPNSRYQVVDHPVVKTFESWPKEWEVSLEVKFANTVNGNWTNILHFTTGSNGGSYGSRNPAIFVCPNSHKLQICAAVNNDWNWNVVTDELPVDKWIKIYISQGRISAQKYNFNVKVDDAETVNMTNEAPMSFNNVKVYAPDPWHFAADVEIRDLQTSGETHIGK